VNRERTTALVGCWVVSYAHVANSSTFCLRFPCLHSPLDYRPLLPPMFFSFPLLLRGANLPNVRTNSSLRLQLLTDLLLKANDIDSVKVGCHAVISEPLGLALQAIYVDIENWRVIESRRFIMKEQHG